MLGNDACGAGAIAAGVRFFAGYPITPSSEIAEYMARELPRAGGIFIQMEDEIASMASVIGASKGGIKAMTATGGPGFTLMQEFIGHPAVVEISCVIVDVMRGGPGGASATEPAQGDVMQRRWGPHGDHPIIVLSASTVPDMYFLTIRIDRYLNEIVSFEEKNIEDPEVLLFAHGSIARIASRASS